MLNQRLQQKLLQKLSPQQILLMKLLQIPSMALEQRIKQEIEENPALEEAGAQEDDQGNDVLDRDDDLEDTGEEDYDSKDDEFDLDDYLDDDDIPAYKTSTSNQSADDERKEIPYASGMSFHDMLLAQLGLRILDEKQKAIAETIIGNLDDSGYLQRDVNAMVDDLAFSQNITVSDDEILDVLSIIQEFDPSGVGARNLQECLLIQLRRKQDTDAPAIDLAITLLESYFNEFVKKHYDKIMKKKAPELYEFLENME